ncbi:L-lysine-epsilon aminotransferase [Phycisphaerae bacterium RAS1]|nr:L-lysine-epsilon aminotransferase [Phycisphaerae bacterium RAS1]
MERRTNLTELSPADAMAVLRSRILVDGFEVMVDLPGSHDHYLRDASTGTEYLDFYSFFASQPVGFNHPKLHDPQFEARLLEAARTRVANSDVYSQFYAEFVKTLDEVAGLPGMKHFFFIEGGALAIENGLKTAFDWKVRKNLAAGRGEIGYKVIHLQQAFHGRTGYTLSMTNTADARKTMYFPKFDWPRVTNPAINFDLPEPQRTQDAAKREAQAVAEIEQSVAKHGHDIACLIIETIQGEGGDNHFRGEFLRKLRELADRHEFLLISDEVQCGVGITGKMWAVEHFGFTPDILCFGKKMQQCGLMAGPRIDDVENVFKVPSRINSTWGGNLVEMVRATQLLRIIRDEKLVENAAKVGAYLLEGLQDIARRHSIVSNVRGRGLMCALDLPDVKTRDAVRHGCFHKHMLGLGCGVTSIRFRPALDITREKVDKGLAILSETLREVEKTQPARAAATV